jgi:protein phosphatase PTC1
VDLVRKEKNPQVASKALVEYALSRFSTDNLSCMVVRFDGAAVKHLKDESSIGVEGDAKTGKGGMTEAEAIVADAKKHLAHEDHSSTAATTSIPEEKEEKDDEEPLRLNSDAVEAAKKNP